MPKLDQTQTMISVSISEHNHHTGTRSKHTAPRNARLGLKTFGRYQVTSTRVHSATGTMVRLSGTCHTGNPAPFNN